jgi:hypothetical protein
VPVRIPDHVADKACALPESSYGAHRVTLILADGRLVGDVTLAWGREIVKIGSRKVTDASELDFLLEHVVDVRE